MQNSKEAISRIGGVSEAGDDEVLAPIFAHIMAKRGHILNIHQVVAFSPKMLRAQAAYAAAMREESTLPRDLQEIVILRIAQVNSSKYEQTVHEPIAIACGVSSAKLQALPAWRSSGEFDEKERTALAFVDQAASTGEVDDGVFDAAKTYFSHNEIVELTVFVGWYVGNSRFVRALRIAPQGPPKDG